MRLTFWRQNVMAGFRKLRCNGWQIELRHSPTTAEVMRLLYDDEPPVIQKIDTMRFFVQPMVIGDERWAAITGCINDDEPIRIIEPFIVPDGDFAKVPLFREEC